jgi:hypothetical protein
MLIWSLTGPKRGLCGGIGLSLEPERGKSAYPGWLGFAYNSKFARREWGAAVSIRGRDGEQG